MADPTPVSPTGKPLVPAAVVPYIIAVASLAGLVLGAPQMGFTLPPVVTSIATVVAALCALALGSSPGLRLPLSQAQLDAAKAAGDAAADKVDSPKAAVDIFNKPPQS
jgi:ribose/xylose/arabinose/galactoside ABC-type transport system permease subunit